MLPRTKIIVAAIIIFLGLIVLDQVRRHSQTDETEDVAFTQDDPSKKEKDVDDSWKEFASAAGLFKVMLPALPQHASEVVPLPTGQGFIKYDMYLSQGKDGSTYMISLIQYPDTFKASDPYELLEDVMKEMMAANGNNKLKDSFQSRFLKVPALDFSILNNSVSIRSKTFFVNKTLFVLTLIDRNTDKLDERFQKFVGSFQFGENMTEQPKSQDDKKSSEKQPQPDPEHSSEQ